MSVLLKEMVFAYYNKIIVRYLCFSQFFTQCFYYYYMHNNNNNYYYYYYYFLNMKLKSNLEWLTFGVIPIDEGASESNLIETLY